MIGYHFAFNTLRDGSPLPAKGVELPPITDIEPCVRGYHASERAIDALMYAPGPWVARVELRGELVAHGNPVDKWAASRRVGLTQYVDAAETLRHFAKLCALDVIHVWKAPDVVRKYLETGRDDLRSTARSAAWSAAEATTRSAVESAARSAVWSAADSATESAARSAARLAAESAARSAARLEARLAARLAAESAAESAARSAQNTRLQNMLDELWK